ncbi:unnamed protein product [Mytilus coruscus]|uniref:MAM domain-containing protein n=1 Tax=Mytilus coruscus TaxID=42192 RepID=A0A6J8BZU0_MYTCO|nr:unnamed protein product [Mytilus coruscus]
MVESASCDFDSNWCNWKRNENKNFDRFKWRRRAGSKNNPPVADHTPTSSNGRYAFIRSNQNSVEGDYAEIYIENIVPSEKQCLSFWYYLASEGYIIQVLKDDLNINNVSKPSEDKWHHVQIDVARFGSYNKYKFVFKVVHGDQKIDGAIALDDVSLTNGACQDNVHDCSFENNDMCAWNTYDYSDYTSDDSDYSWFLKQGKDGSTYGGPAIDHTTGSGIYL